jgi:5-methylcytosine-specific restriction endonuclease McrA
MPDRAPKQCPWCRKATIGPCECRVEASQQYDRSRGPDRQFYSTPRWRRFRKRILAVNPWCVFCHEGGSHVLAKVVDHIMPRKDRPDLAYVASNCRGLCVSCHNRRTRKQEHRHA